MNRSALLQAIADRLGAKTYLEIGVQSGDTFFPLRIPKKIAVDPRFAFSRFAKLNWIRWNWRNIRNEYRPLPSDAFFASERELLKGRKLDLVFVDGLHTYEQSLRDIRNSLRHLAEHGVVVVDDCNPQSEGAASPVKAATQVIWNGDVWKAIAFLRATEPRLRICTLDIVYGLGIVFQRAAETTLDCRPEEIASMTYGHFDKHRQELLNLKPAAHIPHLLDEIAAFGQEQHAAEQSVAQMR